MPRPFPAFRPYAFSVPFTTRFSVAPDATTMGEVPLLWLFRVTFPVTVIVTVPLETVMVFPVILVLNVWEPLVSVIVFVIAAADALGVNSGNKPNTITTAKIVDKTRLPTSLLTNCSTLFFQYISIRFPPTFYLIFCSSSCGRPVKLKKGWSRAALSRISPLFTHFHALCLFSLRSVRSGCPRLI